MTDPTADAPETRRATARTRRARTALASVADRHSGRAAGRAFPLPSTALSLSLRVSCLQNLSLSLCAALSLPVTADPSRDLPPCHSPLRQTAHAPLIEATSSVAPHLLHASGSGKDAIMLFAPRCGPHSVGFQPPSIAVLVLKSAAAPVHQRGAYVREHRSMEACLAQATIDGPARLAAGQAITATESDHVMLNELQEHRGSMVSPPLLDDPIGPICAHGRR